MVIVNVYNKWHLGDNVFNIIFFNKIKNFLEKNEIVIHYYLKYIYILQVKEFITTPNIILKNYIESNNKNLQYHLWIDDKSYKYRIETIDRNQVAYNIFYTNFFNNFIRQLNWQTQINNIIYIDSDLLNRYNKLHDKYKNIDILIINSLPLSNQLNYEEAKWNKLCLYFNSKYNIVTTKKVANITCTLDHSLTIKNIAALSTHVKIIISVNTGIVPGLFNIYTLNNMLHFYNFDNLCFYSFKDYNKFTNCKTPNELPINNIHSLLRK